MPLQSKRDVFFLTPKLHRVTNLSFKDVIAVNAAPQKGLREDVKHFFASKNKLQGENERAKKIIPYVSSRSR